MHSAMKEMSIQTASAVLGIIIAAINGGEEDAAQRCTAAAQPGDRPAECTAARATSEATEAWPGRQRCPWIEARGGMRDPNAADEHGDGPVCGAVAAEQWLAGGTKSADSE